MIIRATDTTYRFDANTGRGSVLPHGSFGPLDVTIVSPNTKVDLKGDLLIYEVPCENVQELEGSIQALLYALPAVLNIEFPEPPVVEWITGSVNGTLFRYEHSEAQFLTPVVTKDSLEEGFARSIDRLILASGAPNRRLLAGLHYFHVSERLLEAGHSQWEFMAESVLNLDKALSIMFGGSHEAVRRELAVLGYAPEQIERQFIPLMILRSKLDVAHPRLAVFKQSQLRVVYQYLVDAPEHFSKLFKLVFQKLEDGEYEFPEHGDLRPDADEQWSLDDLLANMEASLRTPPSVEAQGP
jgi:hypothetical protein